MTQALAGPPSQRKKIRVVRREESPARDARYANGQYAPVIRHRGDPNDPHGPNGPPDTEQTSPEFSDFERTHTRAPLSEDAAAALLRAVDGDDDANESDGPQVDPRVEATEELSADQILEVEQAVIPPEPTTMRSIHAVARDTDSIPEPPPTKPILPVALESSPSAPIVSAGPQYSAVSADSSPTIERKSPSSQPASHRRPRSDFSADDSAEVQEAITAPVPTFSSSLPASFPTSTPIASVVVSAPASTTRTPPPVPTSRARATVVSPAPVSPAPQKPSIVPPSSQASQVSSVPLDLMFDTLGKAALKTSTLPPPPPMTTPMTRLIGPAPNQFPAQPSMLSMGVAPSSGPPSTLRYPALARQSEAPPTTQPMLPMSAGMSPPMSAPIPLVSHARGESPPSVAIMLTNERRANPTTDHAFAMITETPQIPAIPAPARVPVFPPVQASQAPRARASSYASMELLPSYDPQLDTYAPRAHERGVSKWLLASSAALVASALFCAGAFIVYAGQAPVAAHALEPMHASHQIQSSNVNGVRVIQPAQTTQASQASRAPSQVTSAPMSAATAPSFASALDLAGASNVNNISGLSNTPQSMAASGIPTLAVDSLPKVINKYGLLHVSPKYEGHRVFVDGAVISSGIGSGGGDFEVYCGRHSIKVGSQSKGRIVTIPCGGETSL